MSRITGTRSAYRTARALGLGHLAATYRATRYLLTGVRDYEC